MSIFDQRNQEVGYQFNAAGNINFGKVHNSLDLILELEKLQDELNKAIALKVFDNDKANEVAEQLKESLKHAQKSPPNKRKILEHLIELKSIIENVAAAAGIVTAIIKAIELVEKYF